MLVLGRGPLPLPVDEGAGCDAKLGVNIELELADEDDTGQGVVVDRMEGAEPDFAADGALHVDDGGCGGAQPECLCIELATAATKDIAESLNDALKLGDSDAGARL